MARENKKSIATKVVAWIIIAAMLLSFVFAVIIVLIQQYNMSTMFGG